MRPDATMFKVRKWASEETRRINIVEDRKKAKAAKKFQKKAKTTKAKARADERKECLNDIEQWKSQSKEDKKNKGEEDLEAILNRQGAKKRGAEEGKGKGKGKGKVNPRRAAIDKKFGYGGKKKRAKQNDKKSANDMSSHPAERGRVKSKGKGKGGGKSGGKSSGPKPNQPTKKQRKA